MTTLRPGRPSDKALRRTYTLPIQRPVQSATSQTMLGHSGFTIARDESGDVIKRADSALADRLARQCAKQQHFVLDSDNFVVCPVLASGWDDGGFWFSMPYQQGATAVEFLVTSTDDRLARFAKALATFLGELLDASRSVPIPTDELHRKSAAVRARLVEDGLKNPRVLAAVDRHLDGIVGLAGSDLQIGPCHGDLTFANMVFQRGGERIVLIDFLDAYLEAPVLDVAKLLQETRVGWSRRIGTDFIDVPVYDRATRLIEEILLDRVGHRFSADLLHWLEFQNLLRVSAHLDSGPTRDAVFERMCTIEETH